MPEPTSAEQGVWTDLRPVLDEELSRLPDKYRVLVVLCDLEDKTRSDVARQLAIPEGTVASRLAAARTMLAKRLTRRGVVVSGAVLATVLPSYAASARLSVPVVSSTVKAVTLVAAGQAVARVASAPVAALVKGVTKAMFVTKVKCVLAAVLVAGLTLGGVGSGVGLSTNSAAVAQEPGAGPGHGKTTDDMEPTEGSNTTAWTLKRAKSKEEGSAKIGQVDFGFPIRRGAPQKSPGQASAKARQEGAKAEQEVKALRRLLAEKERELKAARNYRDELLETIEAEREAHQETALIAKRLDAIRRKQAVELRTLRGPDQSKTADKKTDQDKLPGTWITSEKGRPDGGQKAPGR